MKQGQVRVALEQQGPARPRTEPCSRMTLPAQLPLSRETGNSERELPGDSAGSWKPRSCRRGAGSAGPTRSSGHAPLGGGHSTAPAASPPPAVQGRAGLETPGARRGGRAALGGQGGTAGRHRGAAPSPPRPGPAPAQLGADQRGGGGSQAGPCRAGPGEARRGGISSGAGAP